jgi:uncharacterized protein (TIGR02679 family)
MPTVDPTRLRATLGQPALQRLLQRLRRRLQLGQSLHGSLTLNRAAPEERAAVDALLGRAPTRGQSLSIDLDLLGELLAASDIAPDLQTAAEALLGPVPNQRSVAAQIEAAWSEFWRHAHDRFAPWPILREWLDQLAAQGTLKRLARSDLVTAETLLETLARLVASWPVHAEPLPAHAARLLGDAHGLDAGPPLATLAVRAAAHIGGVDFTDDAEGRREAWAAVGVLCDELSTPALVFNLSLQKDTPLARLLDNAHQAGDPLHLSLRQLLRWPLDQDLALRNLEVFVCENPTIVALAAHRLGAKCRPLVCVNGQFATPAKVLLRQLSAGGAHLRYHGDFDPAGLAIARRVIEQHGATPWRLTDRDYLDGPTGIPFATTAPPSSPWCPALAEAMQQRGCIVHEEAVADSLLADLAT